MTPHTSQRAKPQHNNNTLKYPKTKNPQTINRLVVKEQNFKTAIQQQSFNSHWSGGFVVARRQRNRALYGFGKKRQHVLVKNLIFL
jgi:hypothetical protein